MCKSPLHPFLQSLPKVEHHLHIEGSLEPSLLFNLAKKNNVTLPQDDPAYSSVETLVKRYSQFTSLDDFLPYYYIGMRTLITAEDYQQLTWAYLSRFAQDGGVHAEIFFDGLEHVNRGVSYSTVVEGINAARRQAEQELGVTTELICCFLRHLAVEDSLKLFNDAEFQAAFKDGHTIGVGLCSTELNKPPHLWAEIYQKAAAEGLRRTAHAGEEGPAAYIKSALDDLSVERIDHGVRLDEDEKLMKQVADRGIMLTVCPISNVVLKGREKIEDLPIRKFLDAGVKFSINSDDPAYFGSNYILDNYCAVHDAFDLSRQEWAGIVRTAIDGSWCSDSRKQQLHKKLEEVLREHGQQ